MKNITIRLMLLAMLVTVAKYSAAKSAPQDSMSSMSAADLEKAGDQARAKKDYTLAVRYLQAASKKDRKNAELYNKLGLAELQNDDLRSARTDFEKASKRNPKFAEAINNIGAVDYKRKNYSSAAKYFKKAVALDETRATYHVNLGAAWFSQKNLDGAVAEYTRAMELDPEAFHQQARVGVVAQIASPEERAQYAYLLAKIYAQRGDTENCLQCLRKAKEDGYRNLANVYKDQAFSSLRDNPQLHEVVPPPVAK